MVDPFSLLLPYNPYPALYKKQAQEGIYLQDGFLYKK